MPIFEYRCEQCDTVFERLTFSGDKDTPECPKCKSKEVTRLMSACSFMGTSIGTCASDGPKGFS